MKPTSLSSLAPAHQQKCNKCTALELPTPAPSNGPGLKVMLLACSASPILNVNCYRDASIHRRLPYGGMLQQPPRSCVPSASHPQCARPSSIFLSCKDQVLATPHMAYPCPLLAAFILVTVHPSNGWWRALCAHAAGSQSCGCLPDHTPVRPAGELSGPPLTRLALATLGSFDFGQQGLLQWVCDNITTYLDTGDVSIRRAAATAVAQVLQQHVAHVTAGQRSSAYHVSWGAQWSLN